MKVAPKILELAERVAKNSHDLWVQERIAAGWRCAAERNDARMQDPDLVPWAKLPEPERERARRLAIEAVMTLLAMGYRIETSEQVEIAAPDASSDPPEVARARRILDSPATASNLGALLALWKGHEPETWARTPDLSSRLAEWFIKLGEPLVAYDVAVEALKQNPGDIRLRQVLALALVRSGASAPANEVLQGLYREGGRDEETVGLLARTHKDLAVDSQNPLDKREHLSRAFHYYVEAYRLTNGYWTGINAATVALVLGKRDEARALAGEVEVLCHEERTRVRKCGGDPYWILATLGEAALIRGDLSEAESWYHRAAETAQGRFGDLNASRRNARLLLSELGSDGASIERCFPIPAVVAFVGHMIDQPGRAQPRFPAQLERAVQDAIRARLLKLNAGFGYASAACGSDILFLEALLDLKGEAHVVLPCETAEFLRESVDIVPGSGWGARLGRVLARAAEVVVLSRHRLKGGGVSYEYASLMLYGLASLRSEQLETGLETLAVWDGEAGDGAGGTATTVERWRNMGHSVEIIGLKEILRTECPHPTAAPAGAKPVASPSSEPVTGFAPELRSLLFADAVGFSELTEEEIPCFVHHCLGLVEGLVEGLPVPPLMKNTWGDGLFFVFSDARGAGLFALELSERIRRTDWSSKGLRDINLRIALHAAPVYACTDPVTHRQNYIGAQVSRAARIEPITPPGHVYASQAFAALAAAEQVTEFRCDYKGRTGLAKNYGTFPTYAVRRRHP